MHDLGLRAGALVAFLVLLGGGVVAVQSYVKTPALGGGAASPPATIQVSAVETSKAALPGTLVTFPLVVRNPGGEVVVADLVAANGSAVPMTFAPAQLTLGPGTAKGAFATVNLSGASAAAGTLRVVVQARVGGRISGSAPLSVAVQNPSHGAAEGDSVQVDYVGRLEDGSLFDTSVSSVGTGPFPKPSNFRQEFSPLRVTLGDQAGTIPGFWHGIVGLGEGMSRTIVLAPADAYGNATSAVDVPRVQDVPRLSQAFDRVQSFPRQLIAQYLNASSQEGDLLHIQDPNGNDRAYLLRHLDAANATIVWQIAEGDNFTIYPVWPHQSRAVTVNDTQAVFRTTPAHLDASLTWYSFWPNASRVKSMNETSIAVEHSPPVGLDFALPRRQGSSQGKVTELTPEKIVVEAPNDHPLAGKTLTFDVTVRQLQRGG